MQSEGKKLKIVWICHFMNESVQKMLGMDGKEKELSPWIPLGIEEIKKRDDIELHVIAPFFRILRNKTFSDQNVNYYCIRIGMPIFKRPWPARYRLDVWTNFFFFNIQVQNLVKKINPDLVNLQGAENAIYSASILKIKRYPILITIQGFITLNYQNDSKDSYIKKRLQIEKKILSGMKYFGTEASFTEDYIKSFNPDSKIFFFHCPYAKPIIKTDVPKEYDLVFFARIDKRKGIEDLIKAVSIVKIRRPMVTLIIIGKCDESYVLWLKKVVEEKGLNSNVIFKGYILTQEEMHNEVSKARISVLPTYNDTIPGTVVESMHLGIPVISYNVGGNPDLNLEDEHIILVEKGNIEKLAFEIEDLLNNKEKQIKLAEKALKYASIEFDNANSINQLILAYRKIIEESSKLTPKQN